MSGADARAEYQRQVEGLIRKGYPELAGLSTDAFVQLLAPLEERALGLPPSGEAMRLPFAIVVPGKLVPAAKAIPLVELDGKQAFTSMDADDLLRFAPIEVIDLPDVAPYLVADLDTGRDTLDVTPDDALEAILRDDRSPLTVDEGLALVTHFPVVLRTHNAFSILGSRCGDRRVTAIWLSAGRPRLGWCWAGNPHSWLGSASCAARVGAAAD